MQLQKKNRVSGVTSKFDVNHACSKARNEGTSVACAESKGKKQTQGEANHRSLKHYL
jgi:hypothetical protein